MAIPIRRYVNIVSGVGGGVGVRQRELILRLFTASRFISPGTIVEAPSAQSVGAVFGIGSPEYLRAVQYFSFVNPAISSPRNISFAAYRETAGPSEVIGGNDAKVLASFTGMTPSTMVLNLGGVESATAQIDLTLATSLADVASTVQAAIVALGGDYIGATVQFAADGANRFTVTLANSLTPGVKLSINVGTLALLMELTESSGAVNIVSHAAMTPLDAFIQSLEVSNNFATFSYIPDVSLDEAVEVATYNASLNFHSQYHWSVSAADELLWSNALISIADNGGTLAKAGEFPELAWPSALASIRFDRRNAVLGPMYRQFPGLSASVNTELDANKYDAARINYMGQTSTAGQNIVFYQRGNLMGTGTAATDMGVNGNEIWLKDLAQSQLLSLQLSMPIIAADDEGRGYVETILQGVVDKALFAGVISVGKPLSDVQKVYITNQTGQDDAWQKVESLGYYIDTQITTEVATNGVTEYIISYQIIYAKKDQVRRIDGFHKLI